MSIYNFGSLNIDDVFTVEHMVRPGETLGAQDYRIFAGGKGSNQSVALGRAGAEVCHIGKVGPDGLWILTLLEQSGVDTRQILRTETPTGRAIIQVDAAGQNSIVLYGGANRTFTKEEISQGLSLVRTGDWVLVQNEINHIPFLLSEAKRLGVFVVFNPSPMSHEVLDFPLEAVSLLVVNETEAEAFAGAPGTAEELLRALTGRFSDLEVLLTLGSEGAIFASSSFGLVRVAGQPVSVVDTTAAGDTFLGYFLACRQRRMDIRTSLETANRAAALAVTRAGALPSIPYGKELGL